MRVVQVSTATRYYSGIQSIQSRVPNWEPDRPREKRSGAAVLVPLASREVGAVLNFAVSA